MRLQDFSNLESTQESLILDEEKTILEHNKNRRFLCHQNISYFEVIKTPRILTFEFLGALKNQRILDDPEHAPEFIPRVLDII